MSGCGVVRGGWVCVWSCEGWVSGCGVVRGGWVCVWSCEGWVSGCGVVRGGWVCVWSCEGVIGVDLFTQNVCDNGFLILNTHMHTHTLIHTAKDHEGLYRLPGVKSKIEEAKNRYDKGNNTHVHMHTCTHTHKLITYH